jgi:hypothetical protein
MCHLKVARHLDPKAQDDHFVTEPTPNIKVRKVHQWKDRQTGIDFLKPAPTCQDMGLGWMF